MRPAGDAAIDATVAEVGDASIVVGIPSFNNAHSIAHVAATAVHGISGAFPELRALVLNSDGGSSDGTPEAARTGAANAHAELQPKAAELVRFSSIRYRGPSGKGSAFRDIFEVARRLGARAVVLLDADLRSVAPDWIERLASPIVSGRFDFVAPLYQRHKFDGTITNSIVFPLTAAIYGGDVRQPIGGDFGVGEALLGTYLIEPVWDTDVARFGIDIWMTTTALVGGFRVAQAHLGAKVHDPKDPGQHLARMLVEVVGTSFAMLDRYSEVWARGIASDDAPRLGSAPQIPIAPVHVDVERLETQFRFGLETLRPIYEEVLGEPILTQVESIALGNATEAFSDVLWTRVVFAFAVGWRRAVIPRDQLLAALTPLYLGRVASFIEENQDRDPDEVEHRIEQLARTFRGMRSELVNSWRAKGGLS